MNATLLYRIASGVLVFFAIGHTYGFLHFKPPSPEVQAVWDGMRNAQFQIGSFRVTIRGFYNGFGLLVTTYMCFTAFLSWHLGNLARTNPAAIGGLGWAFVVVQLASLWLSWYYFFAGPVVFSALAVVCVAWAAWLVR